MFSTNKMKYLEFIVMTFESSYGNYIRKRTNQIKIQSLRPNVAYTDMSILRFIYDLAIITSENKFLVMKFLEIGFRKVFIKVDRSVVKSLYASRSLDTGSAFQSDCSKRCLAWKHTYPDSFKFEYFLLICAGACTWYDCNWLRR